MTFQVVKNHTKGHKNNIRDQLVALKGQDGMVVRRVEAWVEVDEEWRTMVFITINVGQHRPARATKKPARPEKSQSPFLGNAPSGLIKSTPRARHAQAVGWQQSFQGFRPQAVFNKARPSILNHIQSQGGGGKQQESKYNETNRQEPPGCRIFSAGLATTAFAAPLGTGLLVSTTDT